MAFGDKAPETKLPEHLNVEQTEPKAKSFREMCMELAELQSGKGTGYTNSPINELPLDVWLAQIQIKATRAKYAKEPVKRYDELQDTAVYCLLTMMKMNGWQVE